MPSYLQRSWDGRVPRETDTKWKPCFKLLPGHLAQAVAGTGGKVSWTSTGLFVCQTTKAEVQFPAHTAPTTGLGSMT